MHIKKFRDMYLAELQELHSAERQLAVALRHMAQAAANSRLAEALTRHGREAEGQKKRLDFLLRRQGSSPRHTDKAMQALIVEAQRMALLLSSNVLRDAGLIASVQKLGHYEIAAYGTAAALAGRLGLREDRQILSQSLTEKRRFAGELTRIAEDEVNPEAAAADAANEAQEEEKAEAEREPEAEVERA
jgi:ferritin-like metal-binding protein YciE